MARLSVGEASGMGGARLCYTELSGPSESLVIARTTDKDARAVRTL